MCLCVYMCECVHVWNCVFISLLKAQRVAVSAPASVTLWGSLWGRGMWTWCPPWHQLNRFALCCCPERYCVEDASYRNVLSAQQSGDLWVVPVCAPA